LYFFIQQEVFDAAGYAGMGIMTHKFAGLGNSLLEIVINLIKNWIQRLTFTDQSSNSRCLISVKSIREANDP
jgi:hypothetical protein